MMKKVEIVIDGVRYLQRFEQNETYVAQKRAIQSNLHDASEFTSVWASNPKAFDLITAKGYLNMLCEEMRWGKYDEKEITIRFFDDNRRRTTADKSCINCAWYEPYTGVCFNGDSPKCADFIDSDGNCMAWEEKRADNV